MGRGAHVSILRGRAGGHLAAMQGARSVVWYHHMSDEQRRSAAQWPRPDGLLGLSMGLALRACLRQSRFAPCESVRPNFRHTGLRGLSLVGLGPAPRALSGTILGGNASHVGV